MISITVLTLVYTGWLEEDIVIAFSYWSMQEQMWTSVTFWEEMLCSLLYRMGVWRW